MQIVRSFEADNASKWYDAKSADCPVGIFKVGDFISNWVDSKSHSVDVRPPITFWELYSNLSSGSFW